MKNIKNINSYFLILLIVGITLLIRYYKSTAFGKLQLAYLAFKIPIFGKLTKEKELTEFARTLGLLVGAGVPIVEALNISGESMENLIYRNTIADAAKKVEKGMALSEPLAADENFPPIFSQMVTVGQETGKMDEVLLRLAAYFEEEVDRMVKNLSTALEPLIMIVLGIMVAVLILSIITPIYKITSSF